MEKVTGCYFSKVNRKNRRFSSWPSVATEHSDAASVRKFWAQLSTQSVSLPLPDLWAVQARARRGRAGPRRATGAADLVATVHLCPRPCSWCGSGDMKYNSDYLTPKVGGGDKQR